MARAILLSNLTHSAVDLRRLAGKEKNGQVVRRLLALALTLEGHSRTGAAQQSGMDRQTLCDWVHRYNEGGVDALISRTSSGRPPKLNAAQLAELYDLVVKGPDPEIDQVVRWRCVDLRAQIARRFAVEVPERTVAKWLRELRLTRLQPRPFNPQRDEAAQAAFKKTLAV